MHKKKSLKIMLLFFSLAVAIVLAVLAYMFFSSNSNKQVITEEAPLNSNAGLASPQAIKKTAVPVANTSSADEKQNVKADTAKSLKAGNSTASSPDINAPVPATAPSISMEQYLKDEKEKEARKKKLLDSLNR